MFEYKKYILTWLQLLQPAMSGEQMMQAMLANDKIRQTRPLGGQGMLPGGIPGQGMPMSGQSLPGAMPTPGRPIVKGIGKY